MGFWWIIAGACLLWCVVSVWVACFVGRRIKLTEDEQRHVALHEATIHAAIENGMLVERMVSCPLTVMIADFASGRFVLGRRLSEDDMFLDVYRFAEVVHCQYNRSITLPSLMLVLRGRVTSQEILQFDNVVNAVRCWQLLDHVQVVARTPANSLSRATANPVRL